MHLKLPLFNLLFWAAMGLFVLGAYSFSEPTSPFGQTEITLTSLDASCTEVWLDLKFSNLTQPANVAIQKDGKDYLRLLSLNRDTLLIFENLEPSTNYSFRAIIRHEGKDDKISNTTAVRTMDTTSHSFTWEVFEFGETLSSSIFYDIAIIDENNIWAVGEIYMKDSLGNPDPTFYNAAHWDGNEWELKKIYYHGQCSAVDYPPLKAIWVDNENNIVVTNGGSIGWFDGNNITLDCRVNPLLTGVINKMWGTSSSDLYVVGNGGNIAHYNGTSWQKIESGTDLDLHDMAGNERVLIAGTKLLQAEANVILRKNGTALEKITTLPQNFEPLSIYPVGKRKVLAGGSGVYESTDDMNTWREVSPGSSYIEIIRAYSHNKIAIAGHYGSLYYYNGVRWVSRSEMGFPSGDMIIWHSLSINENQLVIVGEDNNNKAVVMIGKNG